MALFLGFLAGWFGPGSVKLSAFKTVLIFLLVFYWVHLLINVESREDGLLGWMVSIFIFIVLLKIITNWKRVTSFNLKVFVPVDAIFLRFSELFSAIPRVILVLAFIQLLSASMLSIILLLALSAWVDLARIVLAELQSIKSMAYMDAAVMSQGTRSSTSV
ncbi:MAG: hypothetical protein IPJ26_09755 [Bacteroidetes bacterium]|nr:hypothetical protein [Bacteroidota bacterium]